MADTDRIEGDQDLEAPEEDLDAAFVHFGKYSEARLARPWEQWSFKEKANFCMDRIFLGVLVIFLFMLLAEFGYKMSFVIDMRKVAAFMSDSVDSLFDWLFTQERQEELLEL